MQEKQISEYPLKWTQRFVARLELANGTQGWAFQRESGTKAKASDYRVDIFSWLEKIQAHIALIDKDCNIWAEYGVQRSGQRFFTTHCTNKRVPRHEIELQCRWQVNRATGHRTVSCSTIHTYYEI